MFLGLFLITRESKSKGVYFENLVLNARFLSEPLPETDVSAIDEKPMLKLQMCTEEHAADQQFAIAEDRSIKMNKSYSGTNKDN